MKIKIIISIILISIGLNSCQKPKYENPNVELIDVYFDAEMTALKNNGKENYISIKYNGFPIAWGERVPNQMRVIAGKGKFEFFDTRTEKLVAEKEIDVKPNHSERYMLFQPTLESPVIFIDPKSQDNESAAPAGNIKIKIANYAQDIIPFKGLDLKVFTKYREKRKNIITEIAWIKDVKSKLEDSDYIIIPDGKSNSLPKDDYSYIFEFFDSQTGKSLLNHGGKNYSGNAITPNFPIDKSFKNIYTIYLISQEAWGEAPPFIKKGDKYYEINSRILFAN